MKENIQAVHASEIDNFFNSLNISESISASKIRCYGCNEIISKDNFQAATRHKGKLLFSCNKEHCISKLAQVRHLGHC